MARFCQCQKSVKSTKHQKTDEWNPHPFSGIFFKKNKDMKRVIILYLGGFTTISAFFPGKNVHDTGIQFGHEDFDCLVRLLVQTARHNLVKRVQSVEIPTVSVIEFHALCNCTHFGHAWWWWSHLFKVPKQYAAPSANISSKRTTSCSKLRWGFSWSSGRSKFLRE